ncbi:hypothetical protein [Micromonospora sp. WMMD812]|uniref:hypothetical protein n=1 Tax=Micromonospora sp. WMMD812 TaxID=3015152 RepID=UPI00248B0F37|nr:hypothetical protein [Micromonospora sp. WMMD812]WBB68542.1 hypothetical protein O7603_03930 [Micromonospora sp. WMMD812]
MGPERRTALFERARELSTQQHNWPEADRLWGEVIDAYRRAAAGPGPGDRRDQQQLARALWRRGMLSSARGRPAEGMTLGREAVSVFTQVNEAVAAEDRNATSPRRDEALAELITAMVDVAESAFAAGQPATRIDLLEEALATGLRTAGPPPGAGVKTQEAMGTAYHNQANALLHRAITGSSAGDDAREAAMAASRASELRQNLADPSRPLSLWELANTYAVYAQCLALIRDFDRARMVLTLGNGLAGLLGPAGAEIVAKLRIGARMVEMEEAAGSGVGPVAGAPKRRWGWRGR